MRIAERASVAVLSVLLLPLTIAGVADQSPPSADPHLAPRGYLTGTQPGRPMPLALEEDIDARRTAQSDSTGVLSGSACCEGPPEIASAPGETFGIWLVPYGPGPYIKLWGPDWAEVIGDVLVVTRPPGECADVPMMINFGCSPPDCFFVSVGRSDFRVTTLADSGPGSLRSAIDSANADCFPSTIYFDVAGTIQVLTPLPSLSNPATGTIIAGWTAPGASYPFTPTVILDGSLCTPGPGLLLESSSNTINGVAFQNFNGPGIAVTGATADYNWIGFCRFHANEGPGIDLGNDGITPNDPGDVDTGPNTLLNYPVFDSVIEIGADTFTVYGTATPSSEVQLFLASEAGNPLHQPEATTNGPAYRFLRNVYADAGGQFRFDSIAAPEWSSVTATAYNGYGTSELALNKTLTPDPFRVTAYSEPLSHLNQSLSLPLVSPSLQVVVFSPPDSVGKVDSIGPSFNTFGSRATYDSLTDYNAGGKVDVRVTIISPDTGTYRIVYTLIGNPGDYLTGIGIDGHAEVKKSVTFAASGQTASVTFVLAPPARGELTGDGVIDVFDVIASIDIIFSGAPPPDPPELVDINCDGVPDVFDVIRLIDYAFSGGAAPCQ